MTIKQLGGVFGRNPTFNNVTIDGDLTVDGTVIHTGDLTIDNINISGNTISSTNTNGNIILDPNGTGYSLITAPTNGTIAQYGDTNSRTFFVKQANVGGYDNDTLIHESDSGVGQFQWKNSTRTLATLTNAGNIAFPSGQGIDFSATAGTGTSELLDDYEEGTWTGVFSDGTNDATMSASFTTGQYVKIGSMVMVSGYFVNTSIGSMSGAVRITGLPFPSGNANSYSAGGGCAYGASLAITANQSISTYLAKNTDYINLMLWDGAAGASTLQASELSDGGQIVFSLTYIAA